MSKTTGTLLGPLLLLAACSTTGAPGREVPTAAPVGAPGAEVALALHAERPSTRLTSRDLSGSWDRLSAGRRLLEVSPTMEAAAAKLDRARAGLLLARSAARPRLGLALVGTNTDNPAQAFMGELNAEELSLAGGLGDTDPTTHVTAGLHASVLLWDGGRTAALERAAEAGVEAGAAARTARAVGLLARLDDLWFGLQATRAELAALEATAPALAAALDGARARLDAGSGLGSEVLSLESRSLDREAALASARARERQLHRALDLVLDLDGIDHAYAAAAPAVEGLPVPGLPELIDEARAARPDLRALDLAVAASDVRLEAADLAGGPTLSAFADGWLDGGTPAWELDRGSYRIGASLGWSLSDGGAVEAGESAARADLRAAQADLAQALEAVELELSAALFLVEDATATLGTSRLRARASARALDELGAGFDAGTVSLERWLGAEADLHRARSGELLAELALVAAHARLDLARGHLPALEPTPSTASPDVPDPASR